MSGRRRPSAHSSLAHICVDISLKSANITLMFMLQVEADNHQSHYILMSGDVFLHPAECDLQLPGSSFM